ncbi:unnamed protein product [Rhizophagus irregularis]|uniref:Hsp70 family protein n=1 Tax=Rhizophagus irregularis TaxID=588596 RepID=A0A2I1FUE4_9GLOM|nr:hypothetical protein RhiirA4_500122 [Rhizophagus irregularis]CAB4424820.1 unnamed protein product [Rhizophagus irregularis]
MNLLEKFDKLNNRLTSLLEENKELKQHYKNLQEQHQELKEKLDESDYKDFQEENEDLKQRILNQEKQKTNLLGENERLNRQCKNLQGENMDLKQRILNQEKQKTNLLGEIEMLKRQCKNLQGENMDLKQRIFTQEKQKTNLLGENERLKRQCKNFQGENQNLKQKLNNLQNKFNEINYKNLQEENKKLKENLNEKEKQFQQHIINLEKQKNEQLEIFSQNLEKALGKLELDELNEVNENEIKNLKEKNKSTTFPLIDDDIKDKEFIQPIEDSSGSVPFPFNQTYSDGYSSSENECSQESFYKNDIRVVVGLDFGATYSGFSYCHFNNPMEIYTEDKWFGESGNLKTNTVLQYDSDFENVEKWGYPALSKRPNRKNQKSGTRPVELFKLHLGNLSDNVKPKLSVEYKKAITDYLHEIGKVIKDNIKKTWHSIDFFQQVLLVLTVPAEYSDKQIAIMRDCVFNAELINARCSKNLQFTTEPEAVAIYCLEDDILTIGSNFMVVDCGGGTVDLTTRKLLENNKLGEITERAGDFCGSTYIDQEFINFLRKKFGSNAVDLFIENNYGQYQYMIQDFCRNVKLNFTGESSEYRPYELEIEETAPVLLQYVNEETKYIMEENEWIIEIKYEDVKAMFDPVVDRIISLIHSQLDSIRNIQGKCSAIFLAGGFSESRYLQNRIKKEFRDVVINIRVPTRPIAAVSRGAVMYGLSLKKSNVISTRVLKFTYGIEELKYWMKGDPINRRLYNGRIARFHCLAKRGTQVKTNQKVTTFFTPLSPLQTRVSFKIFFTREYSAKYCDEPDMRFLGKLLVNLPGSGLLDRLLFEFTFGQMEITVSVRNETNGQRYSTTFKLETD